MNMREFTSSDEVVRNHFDEKDSASSLQVKVLGIKWNAGIDTLSVNCKIRTMKKITKRNVLHVNASIFDSLGWLAPLTIGTRCSSKACGIEATIGISRYEKMLNSGRNFATPSQAFRRRYPEKLHQSTLNKTSLYLQMQVCIYRRNYHRHSRCVYIGNNGAHSYW